MIASRNQTKVNWVKVHSVHALMSRGYSFMYTFQISCLVVSVISRGLGDVGAGKLIRFFSMINIFKFN